MSTVMTVRIDEELLAQLERAAQQEGCDLSAYVTRALAQHLSNRAERAKPGKAKNVMGSLRHLGAPATLAEFPAVRVVWD